MAVHVRTGIAAFVLLAMTPLTVAQSPQSAEQAASASTSGRAADFTQVPGVVIDHQPAASKQYIGSPSIAVLPGGEMVATHDFFGPKSTEKTSAITEVFRSTDRGRRWSQIATIDGMFWATLFTHRNGLYLIGTEKQYGDLIIRRSSDGGQTWSEPHDAVSGRLAEGRYHCAPQPVVIHKGRIWRAMEDAEGGGGWGEHFRAFMMSAPVDADLLRRDSWTFSNRLASDPSWLDGEFGGWLEGNAVVDPAGHLVNILRVDSPTPGVAAMVHYDDSGRHGTFDPKQDFLDLPGGTKKFTIRYDPASEAYWTLSNVVAADHPGLHPPTVRNTVALLRSEDLRDWQQVDVVLHHPDPRYHGFQYLDWLFDGDDLIAVARTAYDDGLGGAHNQHDANFLTFHRIENFRSDSREREANGRDGADQER